MAGAGFPKTAATRAPLDIRAASVGSVSGVWEGWCVLPKAASFAFLNPTPLMAVEKFRFHRIGAGPAALNVIHAQIIQLAGDADLVRRAQIDVFTLRAVPQRGIIEKDFGGHPLDSYMQTGSRSRPGPGFSPDADTKSARLEGETGFQ